MIEPVEGAIVIDDVNITQIGLQDLRSNLTIIPQVRADFLYRAFLVINNTYT